MKIKRVKFPSEENVNFLTQKINESFSGFNDAYPFGIFTYDDAGNMIAGASGSIVFGAVYTDQLWVDANFRMQGVGRNLMEAVHNYGKECGCSIATVQTMSFQGALSFYERLGYVLDFEQTGYVQNFTCIFLKMNL